MELQTLAVIDLALGEKTVGSKEALFDILELLIKNLPQTMSSIKCAHDNHDYTKLYQEVHKFHGGVCYCGAPRLKYVLARLETDLKNHIMGSLSSHLIQLENEVSLLLEHYSRLCMMPK